MKLQKTAFALAAIAFGSPLPVLAQTVTLQAEAMTLKSYVVEGGNRIKLNAASGSASSAFTGESGTYKVQVYAIPESDGQPQLDFYKGATKLRTWTYPRSTSATTYTIDNVALNKNDPIQLVGRSNGDAWARVDKIVFTKVAAGTPPATGTTPGVMTIEAESMALASYVVESGNRIKLNAASGTASKTFSGASGTYKMQVYVYPESDGRPTLEVYKNSTTKLGTYTYPLGTTATSFTYNVALANGDTLKLLGRANGDAWARVDKIVLTPTTEAPAPVDTTPPVVSNPPPPDTSACANPSGGYEGFGRNTTGGTGKPTYRVTNRNDSGAGSLRDAVSQGNRCVVFDVGGTISLSSNLLVRGANVTIDGLTAPSPGITLVNRTLVMQGSSGAGNVVVRGIRSRSTPLGQDAIRVYGASNIVLDRVSVSGFGDGAIDVTEGARDVTIQWSILGDGTPTHNFVSLIAYKASRITSHHNLYVNGDGRQPYVGWDLAATSLSPEIVGDVRNNLIWNYGTKGTEVRGYGKANVVNNYYYTSNGAGAANTIYVREGGSAYVSGNYSKNGLAVNAQGNTSAPYAAVAPATTDAITAARQVIAKAGARGARFGLDAKDQGYLGQIAID